MYNMKFPLTTHLETPQCGQCKCARVCRMARVCYIVRACMSYNTCMSHGACMSYGVCMSYGARVYVVWHVYVPCRAYDFWYFEWSFSWRSAWYLTFSVKMRMVSNISVWRSAWDLWFQNNSTVGSKRRPWRTEIWHFPWRCAWYLTFLCEYLHEIYDFRIIAQWEVKGVLDALNPDELKCI